MATRYSGYDATLSIDATGGGTYVDIAQVIDINGPSIKTALIDVSDRDTSGKRTFLPGLVDSGKVKFKLNMNPDNTQHSLSASGGLGTLAQSGSAPVAFKLTFPDSTPVVAAFSAIVEEYTPDLPMDGALTADCTLQISGGITYT